MAVALALLISEHIVGLEAIDDEKAVEVRAEDVLGDLVAAGAFAGADSVDGDVLVAEDPQPAAQAADAPAGLVGMDDAAAAQGVEQQVVSGPGAFGEALFGADKGGRGDVQVAVGFQEVADFAIGDTKAMLEFGGHGQNDRTQGVAGSTAGVGSLLRMPILPPF